MIVLPIELFLINEWNGSECMKIGYISLALVRIISRLSEYSNWSKVISQDTFFSFYSWRTTKKKGIKSTNVLKDTILKKIKKPNVLKDRNCNAQLGDFGQDLGVRLMIIVFGPHHLLGPWGI